MPSDSFGVKGYVRLAYCIDTEKVKRSLPALESWQPLTANKHSAELPARHLAVQRGWKNDPKRGKGTLLWKRSK